MSMGHGYEELTLHDLARDHAHDRVWALCKIPPILPPASTGTYLEADCGVPGAG
jgi:hypothetical protein